MSLGPILHARLTDEAGVVSLNGTRVFPLVLPQRIQSGSAIVYQHISTVNVDGDNRIREARMQVRCWHDSYDEAHALAMATEAALINFKDKDQAPTVIHTSLLNKLDDYESEAQVERYGVVLDFNIMYSD